MIYHVNGKVYSSSTEYFNCLTFRKLKIRVYGVGYDTLTEIGVAEVKDDGTFSTEIESAENSVLVKLFYTYAPPVETFVDQSDVFCFHDPVNVDFEVDEIKYTSNVYDVIYKRIENKCFVPSLETMLALNDEIIKKISCLTCISEKTLRRFQAAYRLFQDFLAFGSSTYVETEASIEYVYDHPKVAIPLFFALLNNDYTISLKDLFTLSETQFSKKIEAATAKNEIAASLLNTENINTLVACRNGLLLNSSDDSSSYDAKLIHVSNNSYANKNILLNDALDGGGLSAIISDDPLENSDALLKVIPLITLDQHLMHYPPGLARAVSSLDVGDNPDYYEVALGGPELWEGIVDSHPAPYLSLGEYARAIYDSIADAVPSGRLSKNLGDSTIPGALELKTVLDANRSFNIEEHSVAAFFSTVETDPNYLAPGTMQQMQSLQRSVKLSGDTQNLKATKAMLQNELTTSYTITRKGKVGFTEIMFSAGIPKEQGEKIYCRAAAMNSTISMLMAQYQRYESPEAQLPFSLKNPEYTGDTLPNLPDLESLFGNLDTCNCSECQSVYSPAAYLTDLLHWLGTSVVCTPASSGRTGFNALMQAGSKDRRKDIRYLKLNCKNTNTLVPYIDLVNEILSVNLLIGLPGYTAPDVINAYKTLQTSKTAEELLTEPEHRFPDAEALLKTNYFQWALPYDAAYDESTSYLKKLDKPYADLIHDFSSELDQYNTAEWANAFLGLNPAEALLIATAQDADPNFWGKFWGIAAAIPGVGAVLKSADISLKELQDILSARYINGLSKIGIVPFAGDECDVDKYTFLPAFTVEVADRFMRFLRLKRKTGLSTTELDLAIINHSNTGDIDQPFLATLASCMAFAKQYNLEFTDVEMFYNEKGYVDHFTFTTKSDYYKNKFLNPLLPSDVIGFFQTRLFTLRVSDLTNVEKQMLARVFGVSIPHVDVILSYALGSFSGLITINELAAIHRYATFARILEVASSELKVMLDYAGDPFASTDVIKAMWDVAAGHARFHKLDIKLTELLPIIRMDQAYATTDPGMLSKAEELWNQVEKAYALALKAHPEIKFNSTTYLPVNSFDKDILMNVIADHIRIPFGLSLGNALSLIHLYSENLTSDPDLWLSNFVKDPEGKLNPRTWGNRRADFMPVYQLLTRASLMVAITKLTQEGLEKTFILRSNNALSALMADHFFWHTDGIPSVINIDHTTWVQELTEQATQLDIPQEYYLGVMVNYRLFPSIGFTSASDAGIVGLYNHMGEKSIYKGLSVAEFTETFLRAQIIDGTTNDIVLLMRAFFRIFRTIKTLGYNVTDGWSWVWNSGSTAMINVAAFSSDIRRVLHNKYTSFKTWSDVIVPVQNELRARLRDALVALYIGTRGFKNENAIYAYYLLDTQMAPCNQTSRVVAAVSAAQLLVHRALLGIEADVCMHDDDKNEWEWRKNYRVWEANRKVFLYPENWIDPSLRNNKTTIFKNTEDLLQQDEINQQNSELAFAGYLTSLNDVAHLDVRSTLVEMTSEVTPCSNGASETLHVFARSWNPPYIHYYRTRKSNIWSAWEKIELEIDSDHLIPVMFNRKLYLFFPLFVERQHRVIKTNLNGELVNAPYLDIKMCYTKLDFGKWSGKKVLDGTLQAGTVSSINIPNTEVGLINKLRKKLEVSGDINSKPVDWKNERGSGTLLWTNDTISNYIYTSLKKESFYFWPQVNPTGDLRIHCRRDYHEDLENYHNGYTHMANEWGFLIGACDEKVKIVPPVVANDILSRPYMTLPYFEQMKNGKDYDIVMPSDAGLWVKTLPGHAPLSDKIFKKTNGAYVLTYPQQYLDNLTGQPFFYADSKHSLLIDSSKKVTLHEHPFTCKMLEALNRFGIEGLLNSKDTGGLKRQAATESFFMAEYNATGVPTPYPVKDYDFSSTGAYSIYNWEVFFHTVSLIARQLRQSNKFEDALKWINYIFDPANRDMSLQDLRYWKIKPFLIDVTKGISYYMRLLSAPNLTAAEKEEKKQWEQQIEIWRDHPFDPHLIASMRPRAYMLWTVMELIDILSDWGDYLFRQDTTESINEAINLYVLASEILGERPKKVDRPAPPEYCYDDIIGGLNSFSNASARFENYMTGLNLYKCRDGVLVANDPCDNSPALSTLPELTFCIPDNPRMTQMWDRVEDRLYKIRNCMNIDGKKRQLALFAPPIDPALLVRATAMGLDLSDVLSDLAAAPPHYRFSYLLQRANDFTNEVKSLGSQLLTALEKKDGEELSVLRQVHEQNILKASRTLKELQLDEAKENYTTLQYSKNLIQIRLDDYKNREYQNSREENAQRQTQMAEGLMYGAQGVRALAGLLNLIPDVYAGVTNSLIEIPGGAKISTLVNAGAGVLEIISSVNRNKASMSLTYAGYDRRQEDWNLQIKSATEELLQVDRQLLSSEIRIAIAEKELENHDLQAEQSAEIYDWLRTKYTNQALYTWMAGQLKTLHRKCYDLAYDLAKQAQQAFFRDLGTGDAPKINFGNWDSTRAGFFAGERLSIQLKELETSYMQHNTRDYELSKNISLALLDPLALEELKGTGKCTINLPEVLFDMDYPSHYFRRIKSVGVTIPGIAGPYTTVGATLTLTNSFVRKEANYPGSGLEPESSQMESIATSSAQNDSGVFELNFKDERYMPFEHKGAVSTWSLELSDIVRQFDFQSISDVIMHMQYTAKEAGSDFADDLRTDFPSKLAKLFPNSQSFYYAINLRHDMPNEWHELKQTGAVNITIAKNRLPYFIQALNPVIDASAADTVVAIAYNETVPFTTGSTLSIGSTAKTFTAGNYSKATFPLMSGLNLNLPIAVASSLHGSEDFSELILLFKIGVSY